MPRTPRISPSAPAPSSRWRTPSGSRAARPTRRGHRRRARDLRGGAPRRGAEACSRRRAIPPNGSRTSRATPLEPEQFAYSLLTRSQRISHENLRLRDRGCAGRYGGLARRTRRRRRAEPRRPADVPAVHAARHDACQPRRGLADGDLQRDGRHAGRLSSRASRLARAWRRRPGVHRDDLRHAGGRITPGLRRHVQRRADAGLEAHRRFRARADRRADLPSAWPLRPEGLDPASAGRAWTSRWTRATGI